MDRIRLDHVSVTCADLERSIAFYGGVLGLPFLGRGESAGEELSRVTGLHDVRVRWAELDLGGGQLLELLQFLEPVAPAVAQRINGSGASHIGLGTSDLDALHARLFEAGSPVRPDPVELHEDGWEGVRTLYAHDPDGVTIELVERPSARVVEVPDLQISNASVAIRSETD